MPHRDFIPALFATIDRKDARGFASFITADGSFRFGNWPTANGTAAITGAVSEFFGTVDKISHRVDQTWSDQDALFVQGEVSYVRKDGKSVGPLPFMNVFRMSGDKVREYLVYADVSALFQ